MSGAAVVDKVKGLARMRFGWAGAIALIAAGCAEPAGVPLLTAAAEPSQAAPAIMPYDPGKTAAGNYLAGRHAHQIRDFAAAATYLNKALSADPENVDLLRRSYRALMADGKIEEGTAVARELLKRDDGTPLASLNLVVAEVKAGRYAEAARLARAVPRTGLNSFMVPFLAAWIHAGEKNPAEALKSLEALDRLNGFTVMRELHAGLILEAAGDRAGAEKHYRDAEKASGGGTLRVLQALGELLERTGRRDEARTLYESFRDAAADSSVIDAAIERVKAGKTPPLMVSNPREGIAEAFFNVAGTLVQQNSPEIALIYAWIAVDLRPDFPLAQMLVAGLLENLGRNQEAIEVLKNVRRDSPLGWAAQVRMAVALEALDRADEAIAKLQAMSEEDQSRIEALVNLADLLRTKKRFPEAATAYQRAIDRLPVVEKRHWSLFYSLGIAHERAKQWPQAEAAFLRALELSPEQPFVLNYLGYSWVDQGVNLDRARKMIERAVELRPNDGYIVDSLGWALYRMHDFQGAVLHLERAIELRPQDPTINDHLGDAYWRVGRALEARFQWQRALGMEPEPEAVAPLREKLEHGLPDVRPEIMKTEREGADKKKSGL
ncbi:MAG: tetratricopeptide repeat protein [Rhodospirillales bacterium]